MSNNTYQWRREPAFWDELEVPVDQKGPHLFTWLESVTPSPMEYDFILSTDGSGCLRGWGASAAIIQKIDRIEETGVRGVVDTKVIMSATYGSTVQRRELSAFLDGIHEILRLGTEDVLNRDAEDDGVFDRSNPLGALAGSDRLTVLWYTDRANLAKSLLFDEYGDILNARSSEKDLWLRYSAMAQHVCVTPMWTERNLINTQAACDSLCTEARAALMRSVGKFSEITSHVHESTKWLEKIPQSARF
jgi:hypothetical protein